MEARMNNLIATIKGLAHPYVVFLWRVWQRSQEGGASLIAAGCAFYATLALFPGMSVLLSLYGLAFRPDTVVAQLDVLRDVLPPEAYLLIARRAHVLISHAPRHLQWGVWIGTSMALWSASTGTKALLAAIDHMHGDGRRSFLRFQLVGMAMTLGALVEAVLALGILVALPGVLHVIGMPPRALGLIHDLSFAVLVLFVAGAIAALYRFGPTPTPGRTWPILPGTLVATPLWVAASLGFSAYVTELADFDLTYGPLAALAGVMLWFWVSSYVLLLGAALNATLAEPA
jgi:membrane protein